MSEGPNIDEARESMSKAERIAGVKQEMLFQMHLTDAIVHQTGAVVDRLNVIAHHLDAITKRLENIQR